MKLLIAFRPHLLTILLGFFVCGLFIIPLVTFAQAPSLNFTPLAGIPGFDGGNYTMVSLVNAAYRIAIVIGALAAVLFITIAGIKYMATDVVSSKSDAIEDIKSSLLGLVILLSTVLILRTIFGEVNLNVLQLTPINTGTTTTPTANPRVLNDGGIQTGTGVVTPNRACATLLARAGTRCATGQIPGRDASNTCGCGTAR